MKIEPFDFDRNQASAILSRKSPDVYDKVGSRPKLHSDLPQNSGLRTPDSGLSYVEACTQHLAWGSVKKEHRTRKSFGKEN